jgi:UPF0042 nucleotide-binding protein
MTDDSKPLITPLVDASEIQLIVLTGLSGGGKTVALRALEDLEFYCVDNLPSALLPELVNAVISGHNSPGNGGMRRRIAVGVDVRNRGADFTTMPAVLSKLAATGVQVQLVFLDCRDEVLIKRYSESRRRHPLATRGVSFAFRRGLPLDADFVFDARCLPNPHWTPHLRPLSGKDAPVRDFLDAQTLVGEYFADTARWLEAWLPRFEQDDRSYMTIAIGCTGGRHRSVYLVEKLAAHFRAHRDGVLTFHRELE